MKEQVVEIINKIRPALQADGGDVELVGGHVASGLDAEHGCRSLERNADEARRS